MDRKKDVIIADVENIYPVEIEDFLRGHPDVKDPGGIGVPAPRLGEVPVAVVGLMPRAVYDEAGLLGYCEALPRYKRPRRAFFGPVPRNPTAKIEMPRLRERYAGLRESVEAPA